MQCAHAKLAQELRMLYKLYSTTSQTHMQVVHVLNWGRASCCLAPFLPGVQAKLFLGIGLLFQLARHSKEVATHVGCPMDGEVLACQPCVRACRMKDVAPASRIKTNLAAELKNPQDHD